MVVTEQEGDVRGPVGVAVSRSSSSCAPRLTSARSVRDAGLVAAALACVALLGVIEGDVVCLRGVEAGAEAARLTGLSLVCRRAMPAATPPSMAS